MRKELKLTLLVFSILFCGCKEYISHNYLFNEYYYCFNAYRKYPIDMTVDTFKYFFRNNNTLEIIGYRYETLNDSLVPIKDTVYKQYYLDKKSIKVFDLLPTENAFLTESTDIGFSYYSEWRLNSFDKNKLIVVFYNWRVEKLSSEIELYAVKY
ncbi:MAG: hypothetical protein PHS59_06890 [Paludibacter sp.]|nr:hypothetical protein [Paludibacter sp.]